MNSIRISIGTYFQAPMQNMTFAEYFAYINTAGKISARSLMDMVVALATYTEAQEKKNEQYEANFKEIADVLAKLVDKKVEMPTTPSSSNPKFSCPVCDKEVSTKLALSGHMRSHKLVEK